ncbi:MAG: toll/interleukin-1 receptor domain-containing protein [Cytophagaceae bacterium]|nr:toll/interleukin-1 receptor domain-containing protein [Cytophagaceae bacterium]
MNVFISHSWKNKFAAQKIADAVQAMGVPVWLDAYQLLPGQPIQPPIDAALARMDIVLLVWSEQAAESAGVTAEIDTCVRLGNVIIPCVLDDTSGASLNNHPLLRGIKGINFFGDFTDGTGRLKMVLLNYMTQALNFSGNSSIQKMNEFLGTLETTSHLVNREDISGKGSEEEKQFWVDKVLTTEAEAKRHLTAERDLGEEVMAFLQEKMAGLEPNLNNQAACEQILAEAKQFKHVGHPVVQQFLSQLEGICAGFTKNSPPPTLNDAVIDTYETSVNDEIDRSRTRIKQLVGRLMPDFIFNPLYEGLSYYYRSSVKVLRELQQNASRPGAHPTVRSAFNFLSKSLAAPRQRLDSKYWGVIAYTGSALLVLLIATRLFKKGLIDPTAWKLDWTRLNGASDVLFKLLGTDVRQQVESQSEEFVLPNEPAPDPNAEARAALQRQQDDLWNARITGLRGDSNYGHNPTW